MRSATLWMKLWHACASTVRATGAPRMGNRWPPSQEAEASGREGAAARSARTSRWTGCVLKSCAARTINGRRYLLGADAIEPVVERVAAGDAGEALHFCKNRGVYVALDALYGRALDAVSRAWKSGLASCRRLCRGVPA